MPTPPSSAAGTMDRPCSPSPAAVSWKTPSCAWCKSRPPTQALSTGWVEPPPASCSSPKHRRRPPLYSQTGTHPEFERSTGRWLKTLQSTTPTKSSHPSSLVPHPLIGSVWAANPKRQTIKVIRTGDLTDTSITTFEVSLHSCRPHQITIHLASISHPLVGDPLYGLTGQPLEYLPGLPGDGGYFLHAQYSTTPSAENQSILRQLCRPDSPCIGRFTAGVKQGWPLKPARSRYSES